MTSALGQHSDGCPRGSVTSGAERDGPRGGGGHSPCRFPPPCRAALGPEPHFSPRPSAWGRFPQGPGAARTRKVQPSPPTGSAFPGAPSPAAVESSPARPVPGFATEPASHRHRSGAAAMERAPSTADLIRASTDGKGTKVPGTGRDGGEVWSGKKDTGTVARNPAGRWHQEPRARPRPTALPAHSRRIGPDTQRLPTGNQARPPQCCLRAPAARRSPGSGVERPERRARTTQRGPRRRTDRNPAPLTRHHLLHAAAARRNALPPFAG